MEPSGPAPDSTVLAIDVGATTIKGARVAIDGSNQAKLTLPTGVGEAAVTAVLRVCRELQAPSTIATTLAVAGNVDAATGVVRYATNIGWRELPLRHLVAEELGIRTTLMHDVRAACVAESAVGVGRLASDLLVVVIGTGLAAGFVSGGHHIIGASGSAGEMGHLIIDPTGPRCTCGQQGCLEIYASAAGIVRRHAALGGDPNLTVAQISASSSEPARQAWSEATRAIARGLHTATVLFDPSMIILAGGVSQAGELLSQPVLRELHGQLTWRPPPLIRTSTLGARAGQVGAAICAWDSVGRTDVSKLWASVPNRGCA